jgi:hypothetical protein
MDRIPRVTDVRYIKGYRLWVAFDDGCSGEADLGSYFKEGRGLLGELREKDLFSRVYVEPEAETLAWPDGVEFDPLLLWSEVTGQRIPIAASQDA